jgi:hypothetical protein
MSEYQYLVFDLNISLLLKGESQAMNRATRIDDESIDVRPLRYKYIPDKTIGEEDPHPFVIF